MTRKEKKTWRIRGGSLIRLFQITHHVDLVLKRGRVSNIADERRLNQTIRTASARRMGAYEPVMRPHFLSRVGGTVDY